MRKQLLALSLVFLGACASSNDRGTTASTNNNNATGANAQVAEPTIEIIQTGGVPPAARRVTGGINVEYAVRVGNRSNEAIRLRRITVNSVTEGSYTIRHAQPFDVSIAAGEREVVKFFAPANATGQSVTGANGPVTLQVRAEFQSSAGGFQTVVTRVVNAGANVFE